MWLLMLRNSSLLVVAFSFFSSMISGCGSESGEVTISIQKADEGDDFSDVNALRIIVRDLSEDTPNVFGPFELNREQPTRLSTDIPPGNTFYVDVWGCLSVDSCMIQDVLARGCSGEILSDASVPNQSVDITLYRAGSADATNCGSE